MPGKNGKIEKATFMNRSVEALKETAPTVIKRRTTGTMTTIKLDKNFDINIHVGEQYIVKGYDKTRGMYYYQLFFKEER